MFSNIKALELVKKFSTVEVNDIQDAKLRKQAKKLKSKQGGFTLLELLVVVSILAAIAGTATIALQDTDARASAAAHVAMMDELNKGIRTFRVLNKNSLPTGFDSLIQTSAGDMTTDATVLRVAAVDSLALMDLPVGAAAVMNAGGINSLQYVGTHLDADGLDTTNTCAGVNGVVAADPAASPEAVIASRGNAVVAGNIFMSPAANGCGYTWNNVDSLPLTDAFDLTGAPKVAIWTGGYERVMGGAGAAFDAAALTTDGSAITAGVANAPVLMAVGLGPSSSLFNANDLGGMTSVPVYRHVSETEYNRFISLWNIGSVNATTDGMVAGDQASLTAIVDGAGDTKEEELGEWDGTRNTI
jgi:prepilin-type N-terminal cleavage/methylation domain-containing protein